jgi:DNA anti-recombination protein RmuC
MRFWRRNPSASPSRIRPTWSLLDPLKLRINEFQAKIEDNYIKEGKDRSALGEQVRQLMTLNQNLSEDAQNLTRALKGSSKTQGIYGEVILERVLEASGLRKGHEYVVQESHTREDGPGRFSMSSFTCRKAGTWWWIPSFL